MTISLGTTKLPTCVWGGQGFKMLLLIPVSAVCCSVSGFLFLFHVVNLEFNLLENNREEIKMVHRIEWFTQCSAILDISNQHETIKEKCHSQVTDAKVNHNDYFMKA